MLYPYVFVANTSDDSASKVFPIETLSSCALSMELESNITSSRWSCLDLARPTLA